MREKKYKGSRTLIQVRGSNNWGAHSLLPHGPKQSEGSVMAVRGLHYKALSMKFVGPRLLYRMMSNHDLPQTVNGLCDGTLGSTGLI